MAKGPGGTRSGNSGNPQGNGGQRVNASAPASQLAIEDRIIALEGERERLRQNGDINGPVIAAEKIDRINEQIEQLREQYLEAGRAQQAQQSLDRRINASWNQFKLSDLDRQVKRLSLAQVFSLEPADRGDDVASYHLAYSNSFKRYMIRRTEGGRTTTIAESPAIGDLVRLAKKRGLLPVGVRSKSDRGLV